ncbi:hypothetical protein WME98_44655 [Sorangium sp. So ce296]|uniref:hypothetical protein n=1 Tax=Sorangium sp. So ce296 TaxID=3133296 RepID=UPI003F5E8CE9
MQKLLVSSLVLVAATLSASAMALDIKNNDFEVRLDVGGRLIDGGTMACDSFWTEYRDDVTGYPADFCAYECTLRFDWGWLERTNVNLLELATRGHKDCDKNRKEGFLTNVFNDPERDSKLIVKKDKKKIRTMVLGESRDNNMYGTVVFKEHSYYPTGIEFTAVPAGDDHYDDEGGEDPPEGEEPEEGT